MHDPRRSTSATRWHRVRTGMRAKGPHRARQVGEGKLAGMRASFSSAQEVLSKKTVARLRTWRAGARKARPLGCPFSWLLLFGHARESDSAPRGESAAGNLHTSRNAEPGTKRTKFIARFGYLPCAHARNKTPICSNTVTLINAPLAASISFHPNTSRHAPGGW